MSKNIDSSQHDLFFFLSSGVIFNEYNEICYHKMVKIHPLYRSQTPSLFYNATVSHGNLTIRHYLNLPRSAGQFNNMAKNISRCR